MVEEMTEELAPQLTAPCTNFDYSKMEQNLLISLAFGEDDGAMAEVKRRGLEGTLPNFGR